VNFEGFKTTEDGRGVVVEMAMPPLLRGHFFAKLYARGEMNDAARGDPGAVWRTLSAEYGETPLVAPHQVHGTRIIEAGEAVALPLRPEADALHIAPSSSAFASLRFADCAPVVIAGRAEEPWMYILHSGFKGTLQNISAAVLQNAAERYRSFSPRGVWAWVCPAIGAECYSRRREDPSAAEAVEKFSAENFREDGEFFRFDIKREIARQIADFGVPRGNIFIYDCCTSCRRDYFYSYRAGDGEKRLFLLAGKAKSAGKV